MNTDLIKSVVENQMNTKVRQIRAVGKGASGSVQDFFGDWCFYNDHSDVGYFLGCRFVEYLMKTYSLKVIANMKYSILNKAFKEFANK